jgi:hypothetical protein
MKSKNYRQDLNSISNSRVVSFPRMIYDDLRQESVPRKCKHFYLLCVTNGLIIISKTVLIIDRIIKLFLVTFSFVILAASR